MPLDPTQAITTDDMLRDLIDRVQALEERRWTTIPSDFTPDEMAWNPTVGTFNANTVTLTLIPGSQRSISKPGWWVAQAVVDMRQGAAASSDVGIVQLCIDGSVVVPVARRIVWSMVNAIQTRDTVPLPPLLFEVVDGTERTIDLRAQQTAVTTGVLAIEIGATAIVCTRIAD